MISKYFKESEFTCRCGCGFNAIDQNLVYILDDIREYIGKPISIESGCRCLNHNRAVGSKDSSAHVEGKAVDIKCADSKYRYVLVAMLLAKGIKRIGIGNTFVHADISTKLPQNVMWDYYK